MPGRSSAASCEIALTDFDGERDEEIADAPFDVVADRAYRFDGLPGGVG